MIILLFHVLYIFSKFVYDNILHNKQKAINDDAENTEIQFKISGTDYLRDPDAPQNFEEKSVRFYPPVYIQRYMAVANVLKDTKYPETIRKVVDFGCAELDFLIYLKNTAGIQEILCVDIDRETLESFKHRAAPLNVEYINGRTTPLVVEICEGSVTHNDKKLENTDAVICIELIEHLYPDTLTDLPYNIFGYIKPKLVVITTPNADFNVLFPNLSGFRHHDHKFEWTRQQFEDWAANITLRYPDYVATFEGIGNGPEGTEHLGFCTQMAVFKRIRDDDVQKTGIEGLFKTVARHEYPFRTDNRSDEEKLLDEATYYIRYLSFQEDMEEEVPLEKLLNRLKSFHISVDGLQTILEEAGWEIENRDSGPVVLVPPPSYSDYGTVEHGSWNSDFYETENEDDWNREPDPPTNWDRFMEQDPIETWGTNHYWNEEPSIVNPTHDDDSHPFHGEHVSVDDGSEMTESTETLHNPIVINSKENVNSITSVHELSDSCDYDAESCLNESLEFSEASLSRRTEGIEHDLFLDSTLDSESGAISRVAHQLNRTLSQPVYSSVSRASTSPEPYLPQAMYYRDDSMSNQSMSADWMLNDHFDEQNISVNSMINATDDSNRLHTIYMNTSYQESEDSDIKTFSNNTVMSAQQTEESTHSTPLKHQVRRNSITFTGSNIFTENEPWCTSSPKIKSKVTTLANKRRSLVYKEPESSRNLHNVIQQSQLITVSSDNTLATNNDLLLESNTDLNMSTVSTVNLNAIKEPCNEESCSMNQRNFGIKSTVGEMDFFRKHARIAENEVAPMVSTTNDNTRMMAMYSNTKSLSKENKMEQYETSQMDNTSVNASNLLNLCATEELIGINQKEAAILTIRLENNDIQPSLENEESVGESCDKLTSENSRDKIDVKAESHNSHSLKNYTFLNNLETTCKDAKDISDLQRTSLVSGLSIASARDVQNAVLKSESDCNMENREYKCKTVSLHLVEAVESTEMKPASPENTDTPPNSWSPEVMDSGYPNTASAPDMTPEYDLSSIAQDHPSDSESPSIAEAPRPEVPDMIEVENGDLANNNRDGEGNNMLAAQLNDLEDLQPLIDVLENDLENENDIYVLGNGFPIWLLRILNMANPIDVEMHMRDHRVLRFQNEGADDEARYANVEHDEGFDGSSEENSELEINDVEDDVNDANENALMNDMENDNKNACDT